MKKINSNNINCTDNIYYICRTILIIGLPLTIISGLVLSLPHSSATVSDSETDNVTLTLSTSCTLSSSLEEAHEASLNGGQYEDNIGITKVNAYCNDNNGYSIYAIGSSGDIDGNTDLINNINDNYNIHTGIYDSTSTSSYTSSSWSMKLSPGSGTGINPDTGESITVTPPTIRNNYDNYSIVPNIYTLVAFRPSNTNMTVDTNASGSYFTTTYDIYASSLQPAGTYTGKVKYLMVHPQSNNQHFDFNEVFAANGKSAINVNGNSYYAMQDMTSDICSKVGLLNEASQTQLVDIRDSKLYWVAKLADGNCWMTQNLDLSIGNTGSLNSNNTDISTDSSVYTSSGVYSDYTVNDGVYTWNPASTAVTSNYYLDGTAVKPSAWPTTDYATPYSLEGGDIYFYTSNSTSDDTRYSSLIDCREIGGHTEAECKRYFVGNYYNWTAAIASNNSSSVRSNNAQTANSICPKGWRLPNILQFNEFGKMLYVAGISANLSTGGYLNGVNSFNQLRSEPYYFVRPGRIGGSTLGYSGSIGSCWSSNARDGTGAYYLNYESFQLNPDYSGNRGYGRPVRCIVR